LLFYGGPVGLAIYVGARLQNLVPVRISASRKGKRTSQHMQNHPGEGCRRNGERMVKQLVKKL